MVSIRSRWQDRHRAWLWYAAASGQFNAWLPAVQRDCNHPTVAICFRVHTTSKTPGYCFLHLSSTPCHIWGLPLSRLIGIVTVFEYRSYHSFEFLFVCFINCVRLELVLLFIVHNHSGSHFPCLPRIASGHWKVSEDNLFALAVFYCLINSIKTLNDTEWCNSNLCYFYIVIHFGNSIMSEHKTCCEGLLWKSLELTGLSVLPS